MRLFLSPLLIVLFVTVALAAPIPEELAKAVALPLIGRTHVRDERQAFLLGLAAGAGFAVLEDMLYQGLYASWQGWSWSGITLLRGFGSVLHPLCTGLVALGWFRTRQQGWSELLRAYLAAVGLHTLWNGGFDALVFISGLDYYSGLGPDISLYGEPVALLLIGYLAALSLGLWWLLRRLVLGMAMGTAPDTTPRRVSTRALAGWAVACVVVLVPLGAALGPAWPQIRHVLSGGL